jgi:hypothetical protein
MSFRKPQHVDTDTTLRASIPRTLSDIAREIRADWKNVYFGAVPYLDALRTMGDISENYGADDGKSIVLYFLANANSWRGETARRIKAELKKMAGVK